MRIDDRGRPIHKDATFAIRPRIFLEGNFFVDVHPGTPSAPILGDGDTVQAARTTTPVQFDQILTSLQSDTRENLKKLLEEYAKGLADGGGKGFNRSIGYWESAYKNSAIDNVATLGSQPHDLSGYVKGSGVVAQALDRSPPALQDLITFFDRTAQAFAVQQANLEQTVAELPRTLRAARPALTALNNAFPPLRRLIVDFRPAVRSSLPAIDASLPFVAQARKLVSRPELGGLVADLKPTVPALAQLNVNSVALYQQLRLASNCQDQVILPWSQNQLVDPNFPTTMGAGTTQLKVYQEGVRFLPGIASESRTGDANQQWFRVLPGNGTNTYKLNGQAVGAGLPGTFGKSTFPILGANPGKFARPALAPNVPCETQQPPNLASNTAPGPQAMSVKSSNGGLTQQGIALLTATLLQQMRRQATINPTPAEQSQLHATDVKLEALRAQIVGQIKQNMDAKRAQGRRR
jgi:hypothetical protein